MKQEVYDVAADGSLSQPVTLSAGDTVQAIFGTDALGGYRVVRMIVNRGVGSAAEGLGEQTYTMYQVRTNAEPATRASQADIGDAVDAWLAKMEEGS